jgi:hypothetical protein
MTRGFDPNKFNREMRAAARKAEADYRRRVAAYNREVEGVNRANHVASTSTTGRRISTTSASSPRTTGR